ncbi:MAG: leucine-rich repeat domain-containing protein [Flavobacteriales bacterium]|nr:leucine-rich repeat domain-containing protein [Flavobacteriales bacterium]
MKRTLHIVIFCCSVLSALMGNAQLLSPAALDTMPIFRNLEEAMKSPDQVYRLDLSKHKLSVIPVEIWSMKNLNELILDKNRITFISDQIQNLKYLQIFSAQHNEIEKLPANLKQLKNLRELDLADNLISSIPDDIDELSLLEVLALWDNPIEYYPESLSDLPHLKVLDLLHNQISTDTQQRLKSNLPEVKVIMSPPCSCQDGND